MLGRGCGRFLGNRTKGFGCVQSRGTQAGGGTLSHDINDGRRSGRTSRLSDQAVLGTLAGEGSPSCRAYEEPHHPHGNQAEGDRTGIGRHAAEASRPAVRRERGRRGPLGQGVSRGWHGRVAAREEECRAQDGGAPSRPRRGDSPSDDGDVEALHRRVGELELGNALVREVLALIDECIHWCNYDRIKQSLGWMSPVQYCLSHGLAA